MPLTNRLIVPINIGRSHTDPSALDSVTNSILSLVIKQMSSLSCHAEDIFGELIDISVNLQTKANRLQNRIDYVSDKVTRLNVSGDAATFDDIGLSKQFESTLRKDGQVMIRETMPSGLEQIYRKIDPPPDLNVLSSHRDDDKSCLEMYTDPRFFFDYWKRTNLNDIIETKKKRLRRKKTTSQTTGSKTIKKVKTKDYKHLKDGKEFQDSAKCSTPLSDTRSLESLASSPTSITSGHTSIQDHVASLTISNGHVPRETLTPPPPSPPTPHADVIPDYTRCDSLPPPPSLTVMIESNIPNAPPLPGPAPLPPPLLKDGVRSTVASSSNGPVTSSALQSVMLKAPKAQPPDTRNDMFEEIRKRSWKLRTAEQYRQLPSVVDQSCNDVAAILQRRMAVEYSDSEEGSECDDGEWD